jgi:acyl-CoA hydrolase
MPTPLAAADLPGLLRPGMTVYAPGAAGESELVTSALAAAPEAAAGVRFIGVWLPGFNDVDYAGLHPDARATAFFPTPAQRSSFEAGRVDYHPLSYFAIYQHLRTVETVDLALLHLTPPDLNGRCGFGVACDFAPAVLDRAKVIVAHINPSLPRTRCLVDVAYDQLDYVIEAPGLVAGTDATPDPVFQAIGAHLAERIADGATVEVGIGGVQGVLSALAGKRALRIHAGAITDPVRRLAQAGAIADTDGAITAGIAWGGPAFYRFCAEDPRVRFAPVGVTHDVCQLGAIDRFIAINAVIEVDLFGQANAEMIDGRQISSAGGLSDFMRGARLSEGGFAAVALPATARRGAVSRIVPALPPGTVVSVARTDMQLVATEHGVADLRALDIDARARALIAIAAPAFRDDLAAAWAQRRRTL